MTQIATTLSQSQKLIEMGIDPSTADMCWRFWRHQDSAEYVLMAYTAKYVDDTPAWSLSALMELLPKNKIEEVSICPVGYDFGWYYVEKWFCTSTSCTTISESLIDAVFEMVVKLKEKGVI